MMKSVLDSVDNVTEVDRQYVSRRYSISVEVKYDGRAYGIKKEEYSMGCNDIDNIASLAERIGREIRQKIKENELTTPRKFIYNTQPFPYLKIPIPQDLSPFSDHEVIANYFQDMKCATYALTGNRTTEGYEYKLVI